MPPWLVVFTALLALIGWHAFLLFLEWSAGLPLFSDFDRKVTIGFAALFATAYTVYRLAAFHPALRPGGYYKWLSGTPWTSAKPLPLGPIHLVWQDVLLVGIVVGVFWPRLQVDTLRAVQVFLGFYLVGLGIVHGVTGQRLWAYCVGFGVGCMVLFGTTCQYFSPPPASRMQLRSWACEPPWPDFHGTNNARLYLLCWVQNGLRHRERSAGLTPGWDHNHLTIPEWGGVTRF